jgi:hypothetical protein
MPGHFEVYPEFHEHDQEALTTAVDAEARQLAPIGHAKQVRATMVPFRWRWRFVDEGGQRAVSAVGRGWASPEEAKIAVAEVVRALREATYGQRFEGEIVDAVRVLDV